MAEDNQQPQNAPKAPMSNTAKATTVGAITGSGATIVITWLGTFIEAKTKGQVPALVVAAVLGPVFAFITRWAAKLEPDA